MPALAQCAKYYSVELYHTCNNWNYNQFALNRAKKKTNLISWSCTIILADSLTKFIKNWNEKLLNLAINLRLTLPIRAQFRRQHCLNVWDTAQLRFHILGMKKWINLTKRDTPMFCCDTLSWHQIWELMLAPILAWFTRDCSVESLHFGSCLLEDRSSHKVAKLRRLTRTE